MDNPLTELLQRLVAFGVEGRVGGRADKEEHVCQEHRCGDVIAYISRVGHDQRPRGQPMQHGEQVASLAGLAALAEAPTKGKAQRQMDNRRVPDHWR